MSTERSTPYPVIRRRTKDWISTNLHESNKIWFPFFIFEFLVQKRRLNASLYVTFAD